MTDQDRRGPEDDVRSLWQEQPGEAPPDLSIKLIRRRAAAFERTVRFRNLREYLAGALVGALFLGGALHAKGGLELAGFIAGIVGVGFVLWKLARHGGIGAAAPPADAPTAEHLAALRARLEKQRVLLASAWRWYIAPLAPAVLLLIAHVIVSAPPDVRASPKFWRKLGGPVAQVVLIGVIVGWANTRAARRLEGEIRDLDADNPPNTPDAINTR